jgi:triosephosphate isomerase
MNPTSEAEAADLARGSLEAAGQYVDQVETAVFPPFPWLKAVAEVVRDTPVALGAQNSHWETSGAFTGEVSAAMLAGWCQWLIAGHSERRTHFAETDEMVARKAAAGLAAELQVIVCVGEPEEVFAAGRTAEYVGEQVRGSLQARTPEDAGRLVVAYEPIWAIGTGRNADPEHAYKTMRLIREAVADVLGKEASREMRVLYGGSVNAENVASYVELPLCDGCLVGGASLKAHEFSAMIRVVAEVYGAGTS